MVQILANGRGKGRGNLDSCFDVLNLLGIWVLVAEYWDTKHRTTSIEGFVNSIIAAMSNKHISFIEDKDLGHKVETFDVGR